MQAFREPADLRAAGISAAYALTDVEPDLPWCLAEPGPLRRRLASAIDLNPP